MTSDTHHRKRLPWLVVAALVVGLLLANALSSRVAALIPIRRALVERLELLHVDVTGRGRESTALTLEPAELIAHAGGMVKGLKYTNSREALDENYARGFRFFEIDLIWTSDGSIVLAHDWLTWVPRFLGTEPGALSLAEFHAATMTEGLRQLDLDELMEWLEHHPDAIIVTDFKRDNIRGLARISERFPRLAARIVPQIYRFSEFDEARDLGFDNIILTLYRKQYTERALHAFIERRRLLAITIPSSRAREGLARGLTGRGAFVYAHTVNDPDEADAFRELGISGYYTDSLPPVRQGGAAR